MNLVESTPVKPNPLGIRALPVLAFAAAAYGKIVGADEVWLIDPYANLEDYYQSSGFGPREVYHGKRIGQRKII